MLRLIVNNVKSSLFDCYYNYLKTKSVKEMANFSAYMASTSQIKPFCFLLLFGKHVARVIGDIAVKTSVQFHRMEFTVKCYVTVLTNIVILPMAVIIRQHVCIIMFLIALNLLCAICNFFYQRIHAQFCFYHLF